MGIKLSSSKAFPKAKSKQQQQFETLFNKVTKKKAEFEKLSLIMDELKVRYLKEIHPYELKQLDSLCALADKLITFFSRKTMSNSHREALGQWIGELLDEIGHFDASKAQELSDRYKKIVMTLFDISQDQIDEAANQEDLDSQTDPQAEFHDMMEQLLNEEDFAAFMAEEESKSFEQESSSTFKEERSQQEPDQEGLFGNAETPKIDIGKKWIRNLFRKTAAALHPDKEQDATLQLEKQQLMGQLLEAREQGDILAMLQMRNQFVDNCGMSLIDDEVNHLTELLNQQLDEIDQNRRELLYTGQANDFLYQNFYAASPKTRDKKIQKYFEALERANDERMFITKEMKNLKIMKLIVEERYYQHNPFDMLF